MNEHTLANIFKECTQDSCFDILNITLPITIIYKRMFIETENFSKTKFDLLKSETDVLAALYFNNGVLSPTNLYATTVFSSGGITKVLKNLEKRKLIVRSRSKEDKRSMLVMLEPVGQTVIKECLEEYCNIYNKIFSELTKKEKIQLSALLKNACDI